MASKTEIVKIEQCSTGYTLTIDDWHVGNYKSMEELFEYLADRLRSDFN